MQLAYALAAAGLIIDALSLFLEVRRDKRGRGPSGVPVVSLVLYLLAIRIGPPEGLLFGRAADALMLLLWHVGCQFLIPNGLRRFWTR